MPINVGQLVAHLSRFPHDMEVLQRDDSDFLRSLEIAQIHQEIITCYIKDGCEYTDHRAVVAIERSQK